MAIKCFWLEPTDRERRYLRRYAGSSKCSGPMGYHDAMVFFDIVESAMGPDGYWKDCGQTAEDFKGHPLWPARCGCGYEFKPKDEWQLFTKHLYCRMDTGEETTLYDAPDGAMWDAFWMPSAEKHPDGRYIICRVPKGHDWSIDGQASNCTRPGEPHQCWVRHGIPPNLTVDKNGDTCAAGAGSILTKDWHGFLRDGVLTP